MNLYGAFECAFHMFACIAQVFKLIWHKLPFGVHETCPYPFTHGNNAWASNMDSIEFQFISLSKGCHQLPKRGRLKALVWFW